MLLLTAFVHPQKQKKQKIYKKSRGELAKSRRINENVVEIWGLESTRIVKTATFSMWIADALKG